MDAEVINAAAEEDGGGGAGEHGGLIEFVAGHFEHFQFFNGFVEGGVVQTATDEFIVKTADLEGCAMFTADRALEQVKLPGMAVIDSLEIEAVADGPVYGEGADAEDALQFIEQLQGFFMGRSHLFMKVKMGTPR